MKAASTRRAIHVPIACLAIVTATSFVGSNAAAAAGSCAPSQLVTITIPANGLIASKWLSYSGPPRANVLLPACYDPSRRYPLLLLLHGLQSDYRWFAQSGVLAGLQGLGAIVVMPEGGSGWYTDWWNDGERGHPSWETYELADVLPTILARYPILPQRRYHAIAGFSMGGLGATYLGGRLPGFFGAVATLSGFVDLNWNRLNDYFGLSNTPSPVAPTIIDGGMGLTSEAPLKGDDDQYPVLGPPDGFYFDGHDPASLAVNLAQTRVFESTGTGVPSRAGIAAVKADPGNAGAIAEGSALEGAAIYPMNQTYHQALTTAGVDVTYEAHAGGHDIPDFAGEIKAMLAWGLFRPVISDPSSWVNDTVATSGQLWDISYRFDRPPSRVVRFRQSGSSLSISAGGAGVTVTTSGGCVLHTATPATIELTSRRCS